MADISWFSSKEDAQQYLDNSDMEGTIRDAGMFTTDTMGRTFYIINKHPKGSSKSDSSIKMGIGGSGINQQRPQSQPQSQQAQSAQPQQPQQNGIPMTMTHKMESDLKARGFTQSQINKMKPQEAWDNIQTKEVKPKKAKPKVSKPKIIIAQPINTEHISLGNAKHVEMNLKEGELSASYLTKKEAEDKVAEFKKIDFPMYMYMQDGMYVVSPNQPSRTGVKSVSKIQNFGKNKEAAELWWKMLTDNGSKASAPSMNVEGNWIVSESKQRVFTTQEQAEAKQKELKQRGYRTTVVPTEEGTLKLEQLEPNKFTNKAEADEYVNEMASKGIKLKVIGTETGMWEAVRMGPTEFSDNVSAKAQQARMYKQGIRTKVDSTVEGTATIKKLGDNEFLSKQEAMQRQRDLEKRGIVSDNDIKFDPTTGTYSLTGVKQETKPWSSGIIDKGIAAEKQTRVWAAPMVEQKRQKAEDTMYKRIEHGAITQSSGYGIINHSLDMREDEAFKSKMNVLEEQKRQLEAKSNIENQQKEAATNIKSVDDTEGIQNAAKRIAGLQQQENQTIAQNAKVEQKRHVAEESKINREQLKGKATVLVGQAREKTAVAVNKVHQAAITGVEKFGPAAAGGIQSYVSAQQEVVPKAMKLAKAAIQEYAPTRKLMKPANNMAEQNLPSAPQGEATAFGQHGQRNYKITENLQGVPKIAARSVRKGSNVGSGTPKIGEINTSDEAPGDRLIMRKNPKLQMQQNLMERTPDVSNKMEM